MLIKAETCAGSEWYILGKLYTGVKNTEHYDDGFAAGEFITTDDGQTILVKAEIDIKLSKYHNATFTMFGATDPWLNATMINMGNTASFRSRETHPKFFLELFGSCLKKEPFKGQIGQAFIKRIPQILNYRFEDDFIGFMK